MLAPLVFAKELYPIATFCVPLKLLLANALAPKIVLKEPPPNNEVPSPTVTGIPPLSTTMSELKVAVLENVGSVFNTTLPVPVVL